MGRDDGRVAGTCQHRRIRAVVACSPVPSLFVRADRCCTATRIEREPTFVMSHPAYLPTPPYRYAEERYFVREWTSRAEISPGLLWAQRRRNEPPGINVGAKERVRPERQLKEKQFSQELVANSMALQRRRPKQFGLPFGTMAYLGRGEPCSDAAADLFGSSKLNRTTPSGKVSLLASTDTNIRLANLSFGRSGRAH